jgi:hypothetical protein
MKAASVADVKRSFATVAFTDAAIVTTRFVVTANTLAVVAWNQFVNLVFRLVQNAMGHFVPTV